MDNSHLLEFRILNHLTEWTRARIPDHSTESNNIGFWTTQRNQNIKRFLIIYPNLSYVKSMPILWNCCTGNSGTQISWEARVRDNKISMWYNNKPSHQSKFINLEYKSFIGNQYQTFENSEGGTQTSKSSFQTTITSHTHIHIHTTKVELGDTVHPKPTLCNHLKLNSMN